MNFRDYLEEQLKNPEFKKEFDALELRYTIVGGVNGVGKTTFTNERKESCVNFSEIIDADRITADLGGNPLTGCKIALKRIRKCITKESHFCKKRRFPATKQKPRQKKYEN